MIQVQQRDQVGNELKHFKIEPAQQKNAYQQRELLARDAIHNRFEHGGKSWWFEATKLLYQRRQSRITLRQL